MCGRRTMCGRRAIVLSAPAAGLVLARASLARGQAKTEPRAALVVIVARDSPLRGLALQTLRSLFLGDSVNDPAGTKLVPLNLPAGSPPRVAFDRQVLRMSPEEVGRYWVDRRIRGEGRPPRVFDSAQLLLRLVAKFPGAIAYVRADQLDASVRTVVIDGRLPGQAGYPLGE